jgi:hypothetical protein
VAKKEGLGIVTPEQVYEYVTSRECGFYPDKCKETHYWNCPDCGKYVSGNCAIVKLNHEEKGRAWLCEECHDIRFYIEVGKSLESPPTWGDLESIVDQLQKDIRTLRTEKSQALISLESYLDVIASKNEAKV